MNTTYYIKKGRRYYPVSEYDERLWKSLSEGTFLIYKKKGQTSILKNVNPDYASVLAVMFEAKDEMAKALLEAMQIEPKNVSLTEKEKELLDQLKKCANFAQIQYPSAVEVITKWFKIISERAKTEANK